MKPIDVISGKQEAPTVEIGSVDERTGAVDVGFSKNATTPIAIDDAR